MNARQMIVQQEESARVEYAPGLGSDVGKPRIFSVRDTYLAAAEQVIERVETENTALRAAHGLWEMTAAENKRLGAKIEVLKLCEEKASEDAIKLRDTLKRIAVEFVSLHNDSNQNDSVGEIYHLLREAAILAEEGEDE